LPVISGGQEQKALWLETVHSAQLPHVASAQGSVHWFCRQACWLPQSPSTLQPATQNLSLQTWSLGHSRLELHRARQDPLTQTSLSRQASLSPSQLEAQRPSTQENPAPQSDPTRQSVTGFPQDLVGSPVKPAGHEHRAWWFWTEQRALVPQETRAEEQGSVHWLLMHARLAAQLAADRQPATQVTPVQISSLLQSSSTRHRAWHTPLSQISLTWQVLSLKQTFLQNLPSHTPRSGHWPLEEQLTGSRTQPTTGVGLGM